MWDGGGITSDFQSFGTGGHADPVEGYGPLIGLNRGVTTGWLWLPAAFESGDTLDPSSSTYTGTFSDLGITPGTYVSSWTGDTITLNVQAVPIPAAAWLFGSALGVLGWMRSKAK
jgi:hypothetical protein